MITLKKVLMLGLVVLPLLTEKIRAMEGVKTDPARTQERYELNSLAQRLLMVLPKNDLEKLFYLFDNYADRNDGAVTLEKNILFLKFFLIVTSHSDDYRDTAVMQRMNVLAENSREQQEMKTLLTRVDRLLVFNNNAISTKFKEIVNSVIVDVFCALEMGPGKLATFKSFQGTSYRSLKPSNLCTLTMVGCIAGIDNEFLKEELVAFLKRLYKALNGRQFEIADGAANRRVNFYKDIDGIIASMSPQLMYNAEQSTRDVDLAATFNFLEAMSHKDLEAIQFMLTAPAVAAKERMQDLIIKLGCIFNNSGSQSADSKILKQILKFRLNDRHPNSKARYTFLMNMQRLAKDLPEISQEKKQRLVELLKSLSIQVPQARVETTSAETSSDSRKRKRSDEVGRSREEKTPEEDVMEVIEEESLESVVESLVTSPSLAVLSQKVASMFDSWPNDRISDLMFAVLAQTKETNDDDAQIVKNLNVEIAREKKAIQEGQQRLTQSEDEFRRLKAALTDKIGRLVNLDEQTDH